MSRRARIIAGLGVAAAAVVIVIALASGVVPGGGVTGAGGSYEVRAIFDNASFAVPGEDVRIAGAPVGSISALAVTRSDQAAVTLTIDNAGFTPFHANATCAIRPQSLIAEQYVDCTPGSSSTPALRLIARGPGAGAHYLPVTQTSSPVDVDIVQDISQEPVRQRLSIILDELGTGLASRGADLNAIIRRADPALGYTDQVFKILAGQKRVLAQLATDSATVLGPLAQARSQIADFVRQADTAASASAQRSADLARSIQLLPTFLSRLKPLMADLGALADAGTPLMSSLDQSAAGLDRELSELVPFAHAARTALIELGDAAEQSQGPLLASESLARRLDSLTSAAVPSSALLDKLTASLDQSGAIGQLMALLFYGTGATNGFDANGHYVRVDALIGGCTAYATTPAQGCSADFGSGSASGGSASAGAARDASRAASTPATAPADEDADASRSTPPAVMPVVRQALRLGGPLPSAPLQGLLRFLIGGSR